MTWDVFIADRLEVARDLDVEAIRAGLARGTFRDDDLVRLAGSADPWGRLGDLPELAATATAAPVAPPEEPAEPAIEPEPAPPVFADDLADDDLDDEDAIVELGEADVVEPGPPRSGELALGQYDLNLDRDSAARVDLARGDDNASAEVEAVDAGRVPEPDGGPPGDDPEEEGGDFTLARGSADRVEELDLAAMVDVAFQLVLFFLVTATTVLYKSLEVPKPNPETPPPAAAQGQANRTLDDLQRDYILVEVDPGGAMQVDHEPIDAEMNALVSRLRSARTATGRQTMLLSADFATPHRSAVLAYDAANEIGLGIAIARPAAPDR